MASIRKMLAKSRKRCRMCLTRLRIRVFTSSIWTLMVLAQKRTRRTSFLCSRRLRITSSSCRKTSNLSAVSPSWPPSGGRENHASSRRTKRPTISTVTLTVLQWLLRCRTRSRRSKFRIRHDCLVPSSSPNSEHRSWASLKLLPLWMDPQRLSLQDQTSTFWMASSSKGFPSLRSTMLLDRRRRWVRWTGTYKKCGKFLSLTLLLRGGSERLSPSSWFAASFTILNSDRSTPPSPLPPDFWSQSWPQPWKSSTCWRKDESEQSN